MIKDVTIYFIGTDPADSTATNANVNAANSAALSAAQDNRSTAKATKEDLAAVKVGIVFGISGDLISRSRSLQVSDTFL